MEKERGEEGWRRPAAVPPKLAQCKGRRPAITRGAYPTAALVGNTKKMHLIGWHLPAGSRLAPGQEGLGEGGERMRTKKQDVEEGQGGGELPNGVFMSSPARSQTETVRKPLPHCTPRWTPRGHGSSTAAGSRRRRGRQEDACAKNHRALCRFRCPWAATGARATRAYRPRESCEPTPVLLQTRRLQLLKDRFCLAPQSRIRAHLHVEPRAALRERTSEIVFRRELEGGVDHDR